MGQTHIRNLAGISDVTVVAVVDPDPQAAERGRAIARAEKALSDPHEAMADPSVDVVVIVTPTSTHAELIEAAVSAGKAAWSEKPIALDLVETARIVDIIERSGQPVQLGFMRRFDPGYTAARARIENGELGRIELFRALSRDTYPPSVDFLRHSGGVFLDMAVHDFDMARFLVGEVEEVHSWASVLYDERFSEAGDFDTAVTMLRFIDGALGVIETARHSDWGYDIRTEVAGANGKVVVEDMQKTHATYSRRFGFEGDHYDNFPDRFEIAFRLELEAFFDAIREGRTPSPGPQDALETLRLARAATISRAEGRPVRVADVTA
jgi:myo-inositol 2-dehydrogenase/D-chiro-inositol 1-dehydrogenase